MSLRKILSCQIPIGRQFGFANPFDIGILIAFLISCTGDATKESNLVLMAPSGLTDEKADNDTTTKFKKEIPAYPDGQPDLFYRLAQQKTKQLQLDTLQGGYDSLQIRIWYDFSLINLRKLLIIKRANSLWTATSYTLTVDWDFRNLTETIKAKTVEEVSPEQGWDNFLKKYSPCKSPHFRMQVKLTAIHSALTAGSLT